MTKPWHLTWLTGRAEFFTRAGRSFIAGYISGRHDLRTLAALISPRPRKAAAMRGWSVMQERMLSSSADHVLDREFIPDKFTFRSRFLHKLFA